jgi:hypothetical protein
VSCRLPVSVSEAHNKIDYSLKPLKRKMGAGNEISEDMSALVEGSNVEWKG